MARSLECKDFDLNIFSFPTRSFDQRSHRLPNRDLSEKFDIGRVESGGDYRFQFGSTFSINPKIRAIIYVSGDIQTDTKLNGNIVEGSSGNLIRLGIGLDWDLSEQLKLENNINFGLTDNTPNATISLGLKRKF